MRFWSAIVVGVALVCGAGPGFAQGLDVTDPAGIGGFVRAAPGDALSLRPLPGPATADWSGALRDRGADDSLRGIPPDDGLGFGLSLGGAVGAGAVSLGIGVRDDGVGRAGDTLGFGASVALGAWSVEGGWAMAVDGGLAGGWGVAATYSLSPQISGSLGYMSDGGTGTPDGPDAALMGTLRFGF